MLSSLNILVFLNSGIDFKEDPIHSAAQMPDRSVLFTIDKEDYIVPTFTDANLVYVHLQDHLGQFKSIVAFSNPPY